MIRRHTTIRRYGRLLGPSALASMFCTLAACGSGSAIPDQESTGATSSALTKGKPGSFNGDSYSDIALAGGIGWNTLPVAFSLGNGGFSVTNTQVAASFAQAAAQTGALPVTGDFNGDGTTDVALIGGYDPATGTPAATIPVAFSNGDGSFRVTSFSAGLFPTYATQGAVKPLSGDFNGDGLWDIALTGGTLPGTLTPWSTIPVAFSNGDGTFRITNLQDTDFASRAINDGAKAISGDFDGDGKTDIALTGGLVPGTSTPWSNIPVAFSNGDGTFRNTVLNVDFFPIVARQTGAMPVSGDFNGDGKSDIALTGGFIPGTTSPWNTIPVAFSNGDGSFRVTNSPVSGFPTFATEGAKVVAGDFNGDGKGDIALTGVAGWNTIPVAFSVGDGTFSVTDTVVSSFPGFSTAQHAQVAGAWSSDGNFGDPVAFANAVLANIRTRLAGNVVGYAATFGSKADWYGNARTQANAPAQAYTDQTKMPVASVSKVVTTLAAIRVLANHGISLDAAIGPYVPGDWVLNPHVAAITFRQLLSHTSGIKDYGNVSQDYASLKTFFTQNVDPTQNSTCTGPTVINPPNPFNTINRSPCYSNWNFAIFRVLLPVINGFTDTSANRPALIAASYINIVQTNVFQPVGVTGVDAKPPVSGPQATAYAFSYSNPGTASGFNWGDDTLIVGAAGWYLDVDDIAAVLNSLSRDDGRILTDAQLTDMETFPLGWDTRQDGTGYRWIEKNGGWSSSSTSLTTSIALFGPGLPGSLFINSDIVGDTAGAGAAGVLHDAYIQTLSQLK